MEENTFLDVYLNPSWYEGFKKKKHWRDKLEAIVCLKKYEEWCFGETGKDEHEKEKVETLQNLIPRYVDFWSKK